MHWSNQAAKLRGACQMSNPDRDSISEHCGVTVSAQQFTVAFHQEHQPVLMLLLAVPAVLSICSRHQRIAAECLILGHSQVEYAVVQCQQVLAQNLSQH